MLQQFVNQRTKKRGIKRRKNHQYIHPKGNFWNNGLLVLRLAPRDESELQSLTASSVLSSWAKASCSEGNTDPDEHYSTPIWLHFSYMNFQSWEGAGLRLVESERQEGCLGETIITLKVPDRLHAATFREFLFLLDLDIAWVGTWFQILSDSKQVGLMDLKADTLHVIEMPKPNIPQAVVWKGSEQESFTRVQNAKGRTASARERGPRERKPPLRRTAENILQSIQDEVPLAPLDSMDIMDGHHSDDSEAEARHEPLEDLCDLAEVLAGPYDWPDESPFSVQV